MDLVRENFEAGGTVYVGPGLARMAGVKVPVTQALTAVSPSVFYAFPLFELAASAIGPDLGTGALELEGAQHRVTLRRLGPASLALDAGPPPSSRPSTP